MSNIVSLATLISSLSKSERRYLKLYGTLHAGRKDYLQLLEVFLVEKDIDQVKKRFSSHCPNASFNTTSSYLFKVILDAIIHLQHDKQMLFKLTSEILTVMVLFERGLYVEAFKKIQKVQVEAKKNEFYAIQIWASIIELTFISNLGFHTVNETELVQKQMKVQTLLKHTQQIFQHASLYHLAHHRLLYKGNVRTERQKEELNDLLVSELSLISKPIATTFEGKKNHFLFQAYFLMSIGDYKAAFKTFAELILIFEADDNIKESSVMDYLTTIEGVLNSLHSIRQFDAMQFFLDKLTSLNHISDFQSLNRNRIVYIYKTVRLLNTGNVDEAERLSLSLDDKLFNKIDLLNPGKQAEVHLYTSLIHLMKENIDLAHTNLNKILLGGSIFYSLPVYRTSRLINLLIHYELGNHDYIQYEIRSIKRTLTDNDKKAYLLEKIIFNFLLVQISPKSIKERIAIWDAIKEKFDEIADHKYELQVLNIFDFATWIEAKIFKKKLSHLFNEKTANRS
ncbi:hypothetical protein EZ428_19015 [Pedobacter frigiditerrae]|uniref:Uncharacterized protein n=1 Tax=Pedobacter frigiditerrae TaxID=2530452 RepID=A0A4R0MQ88_9SPHI|nr:hypothetical protein [Pedobacter frigiditerrae]TCC88727.1 hypothetical protein EZ428_19015 [Pedobacter frigiditerrae]